MSDLQEVQTSLLESRWLSVRLNDNEVVVWNVEETTIYVQRIAGDWMMARDESKERVKVFESRIVSSLPLNLEWKRWALEGDIDEVRFWPAFPDRPLVVKTRIPVIVPPDTSVTLYINLPLWLNVSIGTGKQSYSLENIGPTKLSNTWYGTQFEGQLCYALKSRARRALEDLEEHALRAVCVFHIRNRSTHSLPVERIRILPEHLSLFESNGRLYTSSVTVTFEHSDDGAKIAYHPSYPNLLEGAKILREADKPFRRGSLLDRLIFKPLGIQD